MVWGALSVFYDVRVDGSLAEISIEQVFVNDTDQPIDAVYVFPLAEHTDVDQMRMTVGEQRIEGEIRGSFTTTPPHRPELFSQRVDHLPPGQRIHVELSLVQTLPHEAGAYELVLPLVAPRFVDPGLWAGDALLFQEPLTPVTASVEVQLDSGLPIASLSSPSHEIEVFEPLVRSRASTHRDFVLRWDVSAPRPQASLHLQDGHALITLQPPTQPPREQIVPRELVWVVDQSCSMRGDDLETARRAMLATLEHVDERDSVRLVRLHNRVLGDRRSHPATPSRLRSLRAQIWGLDPDGSPRQLDGVRAALEGPPDPGRERMVVLLTDGEISDDLVALQAIEDEVGEARLFALSLGDRPNRWLLEEMASFGGGRVVWARDGESQDQVVQRLVDSVSAPVLTDLEVDWGDWQVEPSAARLPALHAGEPLSILARVVQQGTSEVIVRGRAGDGPFEAAMSPRDAGPGRAIPTTWARQKIARLQRQLLRGDAVALQQEILETSLTYQVLSQYTAFEATSTAQVEEVDDYLVLVPTGRTYQSAVQTAPGLAYNPDMGIGTYVYNTYVVDGVNAFDPITGSFALNFNYDAIERIEVITGGRLPETPAGTGSVIHVLTKSGTNNLEMGLRADTMSRLGPGDPLRAQRLSGLLAGPLVRDRMWVLGSYGFDASALLDEQPREFMGHTGFLKLSYQPSPEHRFTATAVGESSQISLGDAATPQQTALGMWRWQWFLAPDVALDTSVTGQQQDVGGDLRDRAQIQTQLSMLDIDDARGGTHDLELGVDYERIGWALQGEWVEQWLGVEPPEAARPDRLGAFVQHGYEPTDVVSFVGGVRLDQALGKLHVGPRLYATWDPWGDELTELTVGAGRVYGHLDLPTASIEPELGLTRLDEGLLRMEREVIEDVAVGAEGSLRLRSGLPVQGGGRTDQDSWETRLYVQKRYASRWAAQLSWRHTQLMGQDTDPSIAWVDGSLIGFAHALDGTLQWLLPDDPWTTALGLMGGGYAQPLGTLAPDPGSAAQPNVPRWNAGVRLGQTFPTRRGKLVLDAELSYLALLEDGRDLSQWRWVQTPLLQQPGWEGPRLQVGAEYRF